MVGIICALDVEKAAVEATLDGEHVRVQKAVRDDHVYSFGWIPCVVILGLCDHVDSQMNKRWQAHVTATAACYTKELSREVDARGTEKLALDACPPHLLV
jgi:hypothetical protein